MIFDQAKNLGLYKNLGINGRYAKAIDWLQKTDLKSLEVGTYEIDGKDVYASVQAYDTSAWSERKWESHKDYTDIQYVVKGKEILGYSAPDALKASTAYDAVKDIMFYEDKAGLEIPCVEDDFVIFFPTDAHKPRVLYGESSPVLKIVLKIKEV